MNVLADNIFLFSDHAPVRKTIKIGPTSLTVASWNVLFEKWLTMNIHSKNRETGQTIEQGGHIGKYYPHIATAIPYERNAEVQIQTLKLLKYSNLDLMGIQEFDNNELSNVKKMVGDDYTIITAEDLKGYLETVEAERAVKGNNDQQLIIYNNKTLKADLKQSEVIYYGADKPNKRILSVLFESIKDGTIFRFENTHVEYGKMNVLVEHVEKLDQTPLIVVGDMNQAEVPPQFETDNNWQVLTPSIEIAKERYTHINTSGQQVVFDHIWTRHVQTKV